MSYFALSLSHRHADLDLLAAASLAGDDLDKAVTEIARLDDVEEAIVISTCNRTEIYARVTRFHPTYERLLDMLAARVGTGAAELEPHSRVMFDDDVPRHLFRVAAGLESDVLGEHQILGQVQRARSHAAEQGTCGPHLDRLFRRATEIGKRVRTDTGLGRSAASVSSAGVELVQSAIGSLAGRSVLVVGAGEAAEGYVAAIAAFEPREVVVANRTRERAEALAARVDGRAIGLDERYSALARADVVLSAVGTGEPVFTADDVSSAMRARADRPMVIVDVAMPRDIAADVHQLEHVTLFDLDDLRDHAERGRRARNEHVEAALDLVESAALAFADERSARELDPLIASMFASADAVRTTEIERSAGRLAALTDAERRVVEQMTRRIVAKLLHTPVTAMKRSAGTPHGERLVDAAIELWELT